MGAWSTLFALVNDLTSFVFDGNCWSEGTDVEAVRLFMLNDQSPESLGFKCIGSRGDAKGPPVYLPNLKSLSIGVAYRGLPTIIRVPALSRLSIASNFIRVVRFRMTPDMGSHSLPDAPHENSKRPGRNLQDAGPIHHVRLEDGPGVDSCDHVKFLSLLPDHTLGIGDGCFPSWYRGFSCNLKQLGPQSKIIRFAVPDKLELLKGSNEHGNWGGFFLDRIEELAKYLFEQGYPVSVVERVVVNGSERTDRQGL